VPDEATANGTTGLVAGSAAVSLFAGEKTQADAEKTVAPATTLEASDIQTIHERVVLAPAFLPIESPKNPDL
jgi:hypothetical protein